LPGQDVYFITPPFFQFVSLTNPQTGKTSTITSKNFDAGVENIYIQSATLDGQPYTRNWLRHSFFLEGGTLELELGPAEGGWGTHDEDLPPSLTLSGKSAEQLVTY
jgi:putative alpha-1,2-mannosidase